MLVDNGFNPVWNESCEFDILNPEVAVMRIVVQDEDVFGDPNFLGQASIPVKCLRTGMPFFFTVLMVVLRTVCESVQYVQRAA